MAIIGSGGKRIPEDTAPESVFGYTVFNDGSAGDYQRKTQQWTPDNNFDTTGLVGPIVATKDGLPEGAAGLETETLVGGTILRSASAGDMLWGVAKKISTTSESAMLEPGAMIAMAETRRDNRGRNRGIQDLG